MSLLLISHILFLPLPVSADGPGPSVDPASPSAIGGAFSSLMNESFRTDLATGAATLSIPIVVPPGRKNVQPNLMLTYSSASGNGICGVGWTVPVSTIQRSTKKGVPRYDKMEDITAGSSELLLTAYNQDYAEYLARIESSFTVYRYYPTDNRWVAYDKAGTEYNFGVTAAGRMSNPENASQTFAWYLQEVCDVYGNAMVYTYEEDGNSLYLKYIDYTSNAKCDPELTADKRVEFIYEAEQRPDKIYNRRAGWPSVVTRRLQAIQVSIDTNKDGVWSTGEIVWKYNLEYTISGDTGRSLLTSVQLEDGAGNMLPAKRFAYQKLD